MGLLGGRHTRAHGALLQQRRLRQRRRLLHGAPSPFNGAAVLPVPAGLVSVSDPNAVLVYAPDPTTGATGTAIPTIEVTYSGVNAAGISNIYISRYRPYHPVAPNGKANSTVTLLTLLPFRYLTEQLQLQPGSPGIRPGMSAGSATPRSAWLSLNVQPCSPIN